MPLTLEPPETFKAALARERDNETVIAVRVRTPNLPLYPANNGSGMIFLTTVLRNELEQEGISFSYFAGFGPLNASTYLLFTADPGHALRALKSSLDKHHLTGMATLYRLDREQNLIRWFPESPAAPARLPTLDDLLLEIHSATDALLASATTLGDLARAMLTAADPIDPAVTRAETAAAKNQNPPGPAGGRAQAP